MTNAVLRFGLARRLSNALAGSTVLLAAHALKRHYAAAAPEDLLWILRPTTALAGALSGAPFVFEPHVGYLSRELAVSVVPACAGINFLVVSLCALAFGFVAQFESLGAKLAWCLTAAALAFVATVSTNALRIALGAGLRARHVGAGLATTAELHRTEGTILYVGCLLILFFGVERLVARIAP